MDMDMAGLPFPSHPALEAFLADIVSAVPESASVPSLDQDTTTATEPVTGDHDEERRRRRRLRRRISTRESARRSPARKKRHLEELRVKAAANRDLAARLRGVRARSALVALTNARLHAEAGALARRLAAARRAIALRQLYSDSATSGGFEM